MGSSEPLTGPTSGVPRPRALDVRWIHGSESAKHNTDPDIQVHAYDERTFILRQNMAVNYEAPFIFLLFGDARAVLIDTGATASAEFFPLRRVVDELMEALARRTSRDGYELLVLHTHAHGDHVAGDAQFADRPGTVVVDAERSSAWEYFGFGDDLDQVVRSTSAAGCLECLASPGHHRRPSRSTIRTPDSCSPATRSIPAGCTSRTGPPSAAPSIA